MDNKIEFYNYEALCGCQIIPASGHDGTYFEHHTIILCKSHSKCKKEARKKRMDELTRYLIGCVIVLALTVCVNIGSDNEVKRKALNEGYIQAQNDGF